MARIAPFLKTLLLISTAIFGSGAMYVYRHAHVAEDQLTFVEGVPTDIFTMNSPGTRVFFTIGGHATVYSSDRPNFLHLMSAINDTERLRVWGHATTQNPVFFGRASDDFHIYRVSVGDTPVVTYAETISHESNQIFGIRIFVWCLFSGIFAYGMLPTLLKRRKKVVVDSPGSNEILDMLRAAEHDRVTDVGDFDARQGNPLAPNPDTRAKSN